VIFVAGHFCSGASIAASEIYAAAGVLQIAPVSSNPMLTELGRAKVFRVVNRDDAVGIANGNYLADHWPDQRIAILHDDTTFGRGIAEEVKKQLSRRGLSEALYQAYVPGKSDYGIEIAGLQAADIAVLYIGGYHTEIALMARAARDRGYPVQVITGMSLATEDFGLIAGAAADGVLFTDPADPRRRVEAAPVVERFRASGFEPASYTLYTYGAIQVWARAAKKAGSFELQAMIASLETTSSTPYWASDRDVDLVCGRELAARHRVAVAHVPPPALRGDIDVERSGRLRDQSPPDPIARDHKQEHDRDRDNDRRTDHTGHDLLTSRVGPRRLRGRRDRRSGAAGDRPQQHQHHCAEHRRADEQH
jgi:hypothetical protein